MATAYRPIMTDRAVARRRTAHLTTSSTTPLAGELTEISAYGCRVVMPVDPTLAGAIELSLDGASPVGAQVIWNRAGVLACRFDAPMSRAQLRALTIQDNRPARVCPQSGRGRDGADFGSGQEVRSGAMLMHRDRRAT